MKRIFLALAGLIGIFSISAINFNNDKLFEIIKNIEIFTNIYHELNAHYVDDLDPNQLMRTGVDAMMNSLDPYTVFYSESQVESYRISTEGKYSGLGARSTAVDGYVTITELYENGPAHKSGLKVGDQITGVNGKSAEGKSYDEVMQIIRGFPGTDVNLTVKIPGKSTERNINLTREEVGIPNVPYSGFVSDEIGYAVLTTFTRNAGKNIARALRKMQDQNPDMGGLIIDLRGNGGGLMSEAIDILGIFLPKGSMVVSTKGKVKERDRFYSTKRTPIDEELPIVVLTNGSSASASEIVSGAIQDYDRGIVMGQRTYGKGLVQNHREVGYNSRIKVTTAKYYIPSGRCIQSREYADGEPKIIPDEERAVFYTKNKRPVLDGGGVAPDVEIAPPADPPIVQALKREHLLFKYVTEYMSKSALPDTISDLKFEDYDGLLSFLQSKSFDYVTASEKKFEELQNTAEEEGYIDGITENLQLILDKIKEEKKDDIEQYKSPIISLIEEDLAQRLFFQKGKAQQRLKNDPEIKEAIALLNDRDRYQSFLQPE